MRKLFKERKLFNGGNYMRKYGRYFHIEFAEPLLLFGKCCGSYLRMETIQGQKLLVEIRYFVIALY